MATPCPPPQANLLHAEETNAPGGARRRVLIITSTFPRWAGDSTPPFILHLAQDLSELGWSPLVLAPHAPGARLEECIGGVRVRRFRYVWPERWQTLCYQGGALGNLHRCKATRLQLPSLVASEWAALVVAILRFKPDVVHSHWILPQGLTAGLATRMLGGVPHVATVHGSDVFALNGNLMRACKRLALRLCDAITTNSSATFKAVNDLGRAHRGLVRIPMGVSSGGVPDQRVIAGLRARHRRDRGPLLVFVGRLIEEKGVADLLQAVSLLAPVLPDVSAVIVGDGPQRQDLERLTHELGIASRVFFAGWIPSGDVPCYLAAADVFIGPSKRGRDGTTEAQGLAFIEAMLAGTPVIASAIGGIVDAVRDESTGLLVRERSPEDIASAVKRLVTDSSLRQRLRENARELAARELTREASARAFSILFERVLAERGRTTGGDPRAQAGTSARR
jgi:glycosyltransferase involved in cell wall biosynthesis